jgi:hypothetical protein
MAATGLKLETIPGTYAVCRLGPGEPIPDWATRGAFFSISKSATELSILCAQTEVPAEIRSEKDWSLVKVVGPLDFGLTGVLASLAEPLAEAKISIFAVSTFDTDYLLVKAADLENALSVLARAGHEPGYKSAMIPT